MSLRTLAPSAWVARSREGGLEEPYAGCPADPHHAGALLVHPASVSADMTTATKVLILFPLRSGSDFSGHTARPALTVARRDAFSIN